MTKKYNAELFPHLPPVEAGKALHEYLQDEDTSPKKFTRTVSFATTPEMFQALQELASNRDLPFQGVMGNVLRHAAASFIESVENFLDDDMRTIFRSLMLQQRRLTRERVVITIDEVIDQQVEQLRFWTHRGKWTEVTRGLRRFADELADYPNAEWREHAADVWLHHDGVKTLMRLWASRMAEESPATWAAIREFTSRVETYAGLT